jgi:hypothetical protein
MSQIKLFWLCKKIISLLKFEPEIWINYSVGINFKFNLARSQTPWYAVGYIPRFLIFFNWISRRMRVCRSNVVTRNADIFIFAETLNQWTSLNSSVLALKEMSQPYNLYIDRDLIDVLVPPPETKINVCKFGVLEMLIGFILSILRFRSLLEDLKRTDPKLAIRRLNSFLSIYFWLPYFYILLFRLKPKIVLCSNDHNSANRSLLSVAKDLGIKTAYVQHASVSDRFHRLDFDYSFLDGSHAHDTYRLCEPNTFPAAANVDAIRWVFLSGVKRKLTPSIGTLRSRNLIGVAFKESDGIDEVTRTVNSIVHSGKQVVIRYHPSTSQSVVAQLQRLMETSKGNVILNSPFLSPVNEYLSLVNIVIASNSTLLLEAVLSGVRAIYFEFRPAMTFDYYGYVQAGIVSEAKTAEHLLELLTMETSDTCTRVASIQRYSHTYNTDWHAREGYLVASHLQALLAGDDPQHLWGAVKF